MEETTGEDQNELAEEAGKQVAVLVQDETKPSPAPVRDEAEEAPVLVQGEADEAPVLVQGEAKEAKGVLVEDNPAVAEPEAVACPQGDPPVMSPTKAASTTSKEDAEEEVNLMREIESFMLGDDLSQNEALANAKAEADALRQMLAQREQELLKESEAAAMAIKKIKEDSEAKINEVSPFIAF